MESFKFVILSAILVLSIFIPSVIAQTPTFLIDDIYPYNASGYNNLTVRVCSNSDTTGVNSFSFNTTLFNSLVNTSIINATITQCGGSSHHFYYTPSNITSNATGNALVLKSVNSCISDQRLKSFLQAPFPQCADFILNVSWADSGALVNVTAFNETWNQVSMNASAMTINQYIIKTQKASGEALGGILLMGWNDTSKSFASFSRGPAIGAADGYFLQHCSGIVLSNGSCVGQSPFHPNNGCTWHGTKFFDFSGGGPSSNACVSLNNTRLIGYDFLSSNSTNNTVLFNTTSTLLLNKSTAISFVNVFGVNMNNPFEGGPSFVNASLIRIFDGDALVYSQSLTGFSDFVPPAFLDVNRAYKVELTTSTVSNFSFISPSNGMFGAVIMIPNNTASYTLIKGQVVNSSNTAQGIGGAVVYAKLHEFFSPPMGISFINSTTTDSNGLFTLRVPTTSFSSDPFSGFSRPFPAYELYVVATNTSSAGVPLFFPTVETNNDRGIAVQGATSVLKPIGIKAGGQVNANVSVGNSTGLLIELNKFDYTKATGEVVSASTSKMSMLRVFENSNLPSTLSVPIVSPTEDVVFSILGQSQQFGSGDSPVNGICINSSKVSQGVASNVSCNLTSPGYLNLNLTNCNSILNLSTCSQQEQLGAFNPWFETKLAITNTTHTLMIIRGGSFVLENLLRFGTSWSNISLPLPAGTYTIKMVPSFEFSRFTSVENSTSFTITAGQTNNVALRRGQSFQIEPRFSSPSLSGNNNINISVRDPAAGTALTNNSVSVQVSLLFRNKTAASVPIYLTYDSNAQLFYNLTANFSSLNKTFGTLQAGKYFMYINVTNVTTSGTRYTSTMLMPTSLSDFSVGVDMGGFTFGTGQIISGKVFAFDTTTTPPTAKTGNITIVILDENGNTLNSSIGSVVSGEGTFSIPAPSTIGFYNAMATVNSTDSKTGSAELFFRVSNLATKVSTDRYSYSPSDNVIVTVEVRNASSSTAISDANVEITVGNNQNPVRGITDSNGKVTITLNPTTITGSTWSFGFQNIKVKVSKDLTTQIVNLETFYGFEVRGFEFFASPEKPSYATSEAVKINVFTPPGTSLSSNPTAVLDGNTNVTYTSSQTGSNSYQFNLGTQSTGRHQLKVTASTSSGSNNIFTGFEVSSFSIVVKTLNTAGVEKFDFGTNELINVTVRVTNATSGAGVNNANIITSLLKVSPPNDINVSINNTYNYTNTSSQGLTSFFVNSGSRGGSHYLLVNVGGQSQFAPVIVSSLKVSLMNATPGATGAALVNRFTGAPGSTIKIYVNATSGGSNVGDNSIVTLRIWAFGRPVEITNTTTNGNSTLSVDIPSFAPRLTYGLDVSVTDTSGSTGVAPRGDLTITGSNALKLVVNTNKFEYRPSSAGTLISSLTYENGSAAPGYNITFERGLPGGSSPSILGTAVTDSTGKATLSASTMGSSDGRYYLHTYVTNETTISAYSGYSVNSLALALTTNKTSYFVGDVIGFNVTVTNATDSSSINATGFGTGTITVFNENRGLLSVNVTIGNSQPYTAALTIPNSSEAVGTYGVGLEFKFNNSKGFASTLIDVQNQSAIVNVTLPSTITAGQAFNATVNSSVNGTGRLAVFSPSATSVVYDNASISMAAATPINITFNLTDTGIYVFNFRVNGVGSDSKIVAISASSTGTTSAVWTGSSLTANATSFSSSSTVYIISNVANSTARVMTSSNNVTTTTSLALTQTSGSNYYTTFAPSTTGNHYVRLDKSTTSGVANSMFVVT